MSGLPGLGHKSGLEIGKDMGRWEADEEGNRYQAPVAEDARRTSARSINDEWFFFPRI